MGRRDPALVGRWVIAAGIAASAASLLPVVFIVLRASEADVSVWLRLVRPRTAELIANSLGLAFAVAAAATLLGTVLGWLTTRGLLFGGRWFRALLPLPLAVPSYLGAYAWIAAFAPGGFFFWSGNAAYGFWGAFVSLTLLTFPYVYLPVQAALSNLDSSTEEAARTLGASPWRARWVAYGPTVWEAARSGGLVVLLYVLSDFGAVSLLRFDTFTRVIYNQLESTIDRSATAALALVSLVLTALVVGGLALRFSRPRTLVSASRYDSSTQEGGWPGTLFATLVVFASLVFPLAVISSWWVGSRAVDWERTLNLTQNSLSVSLLAGATTAVGGLGLAYWAARSGSKKAELAYRMAHLGYGVPGVVVALALVFAATRLFPFAYQTLGLLVFAYAVRFLPQALAAERAVCARLGAPLIEAARTLGAGPAAVLRRVVIPLLRPGLLSAAVLVFLTGMKELPMTLILAPLDFSTLATDVWSQASEASFAAASAPALVLVFVSVVPLALVRHLTKERM